MKQKITFEEAFNRISNKFSYLTLVEFNGTKKKAKFVDSKYGSFEGIYRNVLNGICNHPTRGAKIRSENAKKNTSKRQNGVLKKYGVKNVSHVKEIRDLVKETCFKKYNAESPFESKEIQQKIKEANINNIGVEKPFQSKNIRNKALQTVIEKYGVYNPFEIDFVKEKIKQTNIKNKSWKSIDGYSIRDYIINNDIDISANYAVQLVNKNDQLLINYDKNFSYLEEFVHLILNKENITYSKNSYLKLDSKSYYTDITIDNYKTIIECDGLFWHSDLKQYNNKYHKEKQDFYTKLGYKSLFFREDEFNYKLPIVESIILAKLGRFNERIFARKTKIIELDSKKASNFFEKNHLMGRGSGQCYALTYEDKIVSAIRIIKKKDYIDISRFCSALNTNVIGGLGKLLKHIIREYNPNKIVSFVDCRYGDGHSLEKLGFVEKTNHVSFKWTDFKQTFHRMNFKGNSGYEKGLFKIWDCGQKKFELKGK